MPVLWIFVNFGAVPETLSGEQLYVQCSIGSQKASTETTKEHPPVWFTEMCFGDANQSDTVLIELKQKGFLWDSAIASVSAPLKFVPYSSQHGDGTWIQMVKKGTTEPTDVYRLFMDLRFEFPDDLTASEKEALESKLPMLSDEVDKLEDQNRRLKAGSLSVPQPASSLSSLSLPVSREPSIPPSDDPVVDRIPSVPDPGLNDTEEVTVSFASPQDMEEGVSQSPAESPKPKPVPRPRRGLHSQPNIEGSAEMDVNKEDMAKEEEEEVESEERDAVSAVEDSPSQSLSSRTNIQSLDSLDSVTDIDGAQDSPVPRPRLGHVITSHSRPGSVQSRDRSSVQSNERPSVGKFSADQSSITSEDRSKSDSSSADNVPALELTRALKQFLKQHSPQKDEEDNTTGTTGPLQISTSVMNQFGSQQCFDIRADHIVTPSRRFTMRHKTVRMSTLRPQAPTHHGIDDDLVHKAYCKAVQALINPPSTDEDQHSFEVWSAHKPTFCAECGSLLWGVARQGYKCTKCGLKCHERCSTLVNADCSLHAAKRQEMKRAGADTVDDKFVVSHVSSRLEKQITQDHKEQLQLLGECFGVSPMEHDQLLERAKTEVLQLMTSFKAVIKVRVISAEKLAIREEDSNSIYVSVSVGGQRKRTKTFREQHRNPVWNEEFTFDCENAMDRIKVRVWNESGDSAMAKISQKLTKESDQFLGEKVIEVQSLGETTDLRHKLEKRTRESVVSGKVRLAVSAKDDKGHMLTPYHELYTYVHSKLFNHAHLTQALPLVKADISHGEEPFEMLLPPAFQQISNEFAKRYSIDPLAMAIAHFKCLSQHYILPQALEIMCVLLREIMSEVLDRDEQSLLVNSQQEAEESYSRRKKHGRLASILQQLLNSLRIDLQSYREVFPADEPDKLEEFKHAIKLVKLIVECQHEALDECLIDPSRLVEDSMRQCGKATFEVLMQECLATTAEKYPAGSDKTANPKDFFLGLMQLLVAAILEDRNCYEGQVDSFCKFSLGDLTAHELWYILCERLGEMLDKQMEDDTFPATDYINLLLAMNQMYKDYILKKGEPVPEDVEFPTLFEFYVLKWVKSYEEGAMNVTTKAVASDKNGQFAALENKHLSSSVYDIFWWLHEGNKILDKLSCNNVSQHHTYYRAFAEMIDHVLRHYVTLIEECVEEFSDNLSVSLMLLNNLHHARVNLQNLYESMGSSLRAGESCKQILDDMQVFLTQELTTQCGKVAWSLYGVILQGVRVVKTEVTRVKGVVKTQVTSKDVSPIVSELMNTLSSKGSMMLKGCEDSVLKKLVKELWQVTLQAFQDCLLPAARTAGKTEVSTATAAAASLNFSQRQCLYLEQVLIVVKDFFLSLKEVHLKPKALDYSLAPLRKILSIYQQTTSSLIGQFVQQETEQGEEDVGDETAENLGEISLQLETSVHPGSQELEITVHVMSLSSLKPFTAGSTVQKPFVEIYLVGPNIHGLTRRHRTGPAKATGQNFVFAHEVKRMTIPHTVMFEELELQVMVKTQGFFAGGHGNLLGLTVLQLRNHLEQSSSQQLELVGRLKISPAGEAIISVLMQRGTDELAKEFVSLKQEERKGAHHTAVGN